MSVWKLLFSFEGRIQRSRFWLGVLCWLGIEWGGYLVFAVLRRSFEAHPFGFAFLGLIWGTALTWALVAIQVKRWHDRGKSGFMVLILLVPVLGAVWSFVELGLLAGRIGTNDYGPDPLAGARGITAQRSAAHPPADRPDA